MPLEKAPTPKRKSELIVQNLGEETIVYDQTSQRAHALNRTASLVFEKLNGKHDLAEVARDLETAVGKDRSKGLVAAALHELSAAGLLEPGAAIPRRLILTGMALAVAPVIASIAVPAAAGAGSCVTVSGPCTYLGGECCAGLDCVYMGFGYGYQCQSPPA